MEEEQRDDFFNFFLLVVTLLALDFLMAKYERPPSDIDHDHEWHAVYLNKLKLPTSADILISKQCVTWW